VGIFLSFEFFDVLELLQVPQEVASSLSCSQEKESSEERVLGAEINQVLSFDFVDLYKFFSVFFLFL